MRKVITTTLAIATTLRRPPPGSATQAVLGKVGLLVLTFDLVGSEVYLWGGKHRNEG